ncbi:MAG: right-handed parallel beta-helix repeat-containing protein [Candidatus Thorarchaeota archaeon]
MTSKVYLKPTLLVVMFLFISYTTLVADYASTQSNEVEVIHNFASSYTQHGPIFISTNQDFIDQSWPGNGSEVNPFVIEGLNISSPQIPIDVRYVDVHFEIRDCFLQATTWNYTINLFHAYNGKIKDCVIYSGYGGIKVDYSDNLTMTETNVTAMNWAVAEFQYSNNVNVTVCSFLESEANGFPMQVGISYCEDSIVSDCFFDTAVLQIGRCSNLTVTNNVFVNGGITISATSGSEPIFDYTITGNSANGKPILFLEDTIDLTINADNYAQVILLQCDSIVVQNGNMGHVSYGVQLLYSTFCSIENLVTHGTTQAVRAQYSNNTLVSGCTAQVGHGFGISIYYSYDCVVQDNILFGDASGGSKLIYVASCYDSVVQRNQLSGVTFTGIEVSGYDCSVLDNTITSCFTGIRLSGARLNIEGNKIVETSDDYVQPPDSKGILAAPLWNSTIIDNDFLYGDDWGILYLGNGTQFIGNRFIDNFGIGLEIYMGSTNNTIHGNLFDRNYGGNALDNGFSNQWDDGVNSGNSWSDYDQETGGPYEILGTASSQDRYPLADIDAPEISHPTDVTYTISETIVNVTWQVSDTFPSQYWLYHNGEILHQGTWTSGSLSFSINVTIGPSHNVTLVLSDLRGLLSSDTVMLTLQDSGPGGPIEIDPLILIVGGGVSVVLVLAIVFFRKRK